MIGLNKPDLQPFSYVVSHSSQDMIKVGTNHEFYEIL